MSDMTRTQIFRWLKDQPTVERVEADSGLLAVDITHGWAVMMIARRGRGPSANVLLADLAEATGIRRAAIESGIEHGHTLRQIQHHEAKRQSDRARARHHEGGAQ